MVGLPQRRDRVEIARGHQVQHLLVALPGKVMRQVMREIGGLHQQRPGVHERRERVRRRLPFRGARADADGQRQDRHPGMQTGEEGQHGADPVIAVEDAGILGQPAVDERLRRRIGGDRAQQGLEPAGRGAQMPAQPAEVVREQHDDPPRRPARAAQAERDQLRDLQMMRHRHRAHRVGRRGFVPGRRQRALEERRIGVEGREGRRALRAGAEPGRGRRGPEQQRPDHGCASRKLEVSSSE